MTIANFLFYSKQNASVRVEFFQNHFEGEGWGLKQEVVMRQASPIIISLIHESLITALGHKVTRRILSFLEESNQKMEFGEVAPLLAILFVIQLILSFCMMLVVIKYPITIYKVWKRFVMRVIVKARSCAYMLQNFAI